MGFAANTSIRGRVLRWAEVFIFLGIAMVGRALRCAPFPVIAFALLLPQSTSAQPGPPSEYQVKAAFIFNFTKFIEWPSSAFSSATSPYTVGIIGEDPFDGALEKALGGQELGGRKFVIRPVSKPAEAKQCQIIFIGRSEKRHMTEILGAVQELPILTISETEGFIKSGGIIYLYMENRKVRFEISDVAAKRAGLKISSKLMNLSKAPAS